jgi:hypothetical protein
MVAARPAPPIAPLPCHVERTVFRALSATAGWTGATVIGPARAELVPELMDLPRPRQMVYLCRRHTHVDVRKHTSHGDAAPGARPTSRPTAARPARRIRHSK